MDIDLMQPAAMSVAASLEPAALDSAQLLPPVPALPSSLIELILAHVPHASRKPNPTYLFALMVLPPSVVPLAFQSILYAANQPMPQSDPTPSCDDDTVTDPWLCVSRLARPLPGFERMLDLALPVLTLAASRADVLHTKGEMVDRFIVGLSKSGNLTGLEQCAASSLIAKSPRILYKYLAAASESGLASVLDWWFKALNKFTPLKSSFGWVACVCDCLQMACRVGSMQVVDWWAEYLDSQAQDMDTFIHSSSPCWLEMFSLGHVDLLTHFNLRLNCDVGLNWDEDGGSDQVCYMDIASAHGQTAALDWIMSYATPPYYTTEAMDRASAAGHVNVLDWWAKCGLPLKFTPAAKADAARAGHRAVVDWWNTFPMYRTLLCGTLLPYNPTANAHTTDAVTLGSFGCLDWIAELAQVPPSRIVRPEDAFAMQSSALATFMSWFHTS